MTEARRIGEGWLDVEAALPDGWTQGAYRVWRDDRPWVAWAHSVHDHGGSEEVEAATLPAALQGLARLLRAAAATREESGVPRPPDPSSADGPRPSRA